MSTPGHGMRSERDERRRWFELWHRVEGGVNNASTWMVWRVGPTTGGEMWFSTEAEAREYIEAELDAAPPATQVASPVSVEGHRVEGPRHGLRPLVEQATPGRPWKPTLDNRSHLDMRIPRFDLYFVPPDARLIALAPELAVLLADAKDALAWCLGDRPKGWSDDENNNPRLRALLARIEEQEGKA